MIVDPAILWLFVPAALALNLTPGADMMFCLGQGLRAGPWAALAADAGIAAGCLLHVAAAGLGLGALVAAAPWAFEAIRWAGVLYLLWLAARMLRGGTAGAGTGAPLTPVRALLQGLAVNLLNPKVILFVLAFLPQFVDPAAPILPQFLILGGVIALGGLVVNGAVGVMAAGLGARLAGGGAVQVWLGRAVAAIFAGLALRLALMQRG
ncbi:MAG TPA: LysE family translocator [Paracoccaceae bacterium]|nr:LysE family translocator [Paracoccaceae bacterium]